MLWGLGLQFLFGILVLKTQFGFDAFKWLGDRVSEFLEHTNAGSIFVFGETYGDHFFAFSVRIFTSFNCGKQFLSRASRQMRASEAAYLSYHALIVIIICRRGRPEF